MNASLITRRVKKSLVLGCVLATGLVVAPAQAAFTAPPVVQSTSLSGNNQWSKVSAAISVDYNRAIDVANSSVVVTDGSGFPVTGLTDTPFVMAPVNNVPTRFNTATDVLYFDPQVDFSEEEGPYTATFTARAIGQDPLSASTVSGFTFRVDLKKPATPSLGNLGTPLPRPNTTNLVGIANPSPSALQILSSEDAAQLAGLAKDAGDAYGNFDLASGISKVTLHFFAASSVGVHQPGEDPVADPPSVYAQETKRITLSNACDTALCPPDFSFSGSDTTLTAGYWTVRASATDFAGNVSGQSDAVAFLVVKA